MSWTRVSIANCKTASIRRAPWIPLCDTDIVGIRDGPDTNRQTNTVKHGDYVEIDAEQVCYDWTNRKFFKVRNPEGWICSGCVDLGGESND